MENKTFRMLFAPTKSAGYKMTKWDHTAQITLVLSFLLMMYLFEHQELLVNRTYELIAMGVMGVVVASNIPWIVKYFVTEYKSVALDAKRIAFQRKALEQESVDAQQQGRRVRDYRELCADGAIPVAMQIPRLW